MHKPNLSSFFKSVRGSVSKHSPEILTGIGIAGMITSTVLAVKATPKAVRLIEEEKRRQNRELRKEAEKNGESSVPQIDKLPAMDVIKTTWKCYIPTVVTMVSSVACMIGASSVHARRNAALATAYKLSETALVEYKEKVLEAVGEKKERAIRDKVAESRIEKNPVSKSEVIITEKGTTRCFDYHSGRYFNSDIDHIKKAVNELNRAMTIDMYVSLNEFYDELGLSHTRLGDELGWKLDDGLIDVDFSSQVCEDGVPCLVLDYTIAPRRNYNYFM